MFCQIESRLSSCISVFYKLIKKNKKSQHNICKYKISNNNRLKVFLANQRFNIPRTTNPPKKMKKEHKMDQTE